MHSIMLLFYRQFWQLSNSPKHAGPEYDSNQNKIKIVQQKNKLANLTGNQNCS